MKNYQSIGNILAGIGALFTIASMTPDQESILRHGAPIGAALVLLGLYFLNKKAKPEN